jgi:hypothetical protein
MGGASTAGSSWLVLCMSITTTSRPREGQVSRPCPQGPCPITGKCRTPASSIRGATTEECSPVSPVGTAGEAHAQTCTLRGRERPHQIAFADDADKRTTVILDHRQRGYLSEHRLPSDVRQQVRRAAGTQTRRVQATNPHSLLPFAKDQPPRWTRITPPCPDTPLAASTVSRQHHRPRIADGRQKRSARHCWRFRSTHAPKTPRSQ